MASYPPRSGPAAGRLPQRGRAGYAVAVVVAGLALAFCVFLPWAGIEARIEALGRGVSHDVRGIDTTAGLYSLVAALAATALGITGLVGRRLLAALAVVPGGVSAVALVLFVTSRSGLGDRVSVDLGLLRIEPMLRPGWFGAAAAALTVLVCAALSATRPPPPG
ncbi:hypothetical protein [Nonomuraea sp. NPDC046570]|uniref:hypothetical protein n=1 Tax=Nonomuraea sp. NPDC046570 TaxID=3155255 RepID=UPI0033C7CE2F